MRRIGQRCMGGRGAREYRNITHGWRIPRGLNRRGPEMGYVRSFLLSAIVLAHGGKGSEPFVGTAREAEEGEEQCEVKWP